MKWYDLRMENEMGMSWKNAFECDGRKKDLLIRCYVARHGKKKKTEQK